MSKGKKTADSSTLGIITGLLMGSLTSLVAFFALAAVTSLICLKTDTAPEILKYPVMVISCISGFLGGTVAIGRIRKNGLIFGAACAVPSFSIIFLICSIASQSGIAVIGWISAGLMALFSAIGGIVRANKRK